MTTLYIEGSLCPRYGVAGWGASVFHLGQDYLSGPLDGGYGGSTLMELAAVQAAVQAVVGRRMVSPGGKLVLCLRSTAALAVLSWVFAEAEIVGAVDRPKRLRPHVQDFQPLYDLHDEVERLKLKVTLMLVTKGKESEAALEAARVEMDNMRPRRAAR